MSRPRRDCVPAAATEGSCSSRGAAPVGARITMGAASAVVVAGVWDAGEVGAGATAVATDGADDVVAEGGAAAGVVDVDMPGTLCGAEPGGAVDAAAGGGAAAVA